jgi:FkbM family methyltransferase
MLGAYASYNEETGFNEYCPGEVFVGIFERINIHPKGIIHVGMWDFCEHACYTKLVGNKVIGVEANKFIYETMSKPVADRCGYKSFNEYLYSEDNVEKDFYMAGEGSSLYPGPSYWNKTNSVKIKTKTLSTLIEENNIDMNEYDFLNIDAEGAELDILRGFEKYLSYINVIDLETSVDDRHNSGVTHELVDEWLSERGFELTEMSSSYKHQGWGDSLFVRNTRDHAPFRK